MKLEALAFLHLGSNLDQEDLYPRPTEVVRNYDFPGMHVGRINATS